MSAGEQRARVAVTVLGIALILAAVALAECLWRIDNLGRQNAALRDLLTLEFRARRAGEHDANRVRMETGGRP
jgi:hypothetical protein